MEPAVWTDAMLTALERGVKGGVWRGVAEGGRVGSGAKLKLMD